MLQVGKPVMTRDDTIAALQAIAHLLDQRVDVWRIIVDETGKEIKRLYRGSFVAPPKDSPNQTAPAGRQRPGNFNSW